MQQLRELVPHVTASQRTPTQHSLLHSRKAGKTECFSVAAQFLSSCSNTRLSETLSMFNRVTYRRSQLTFTRKPSYYVPEASTHKTGSDESAAQQPPQSKRRKENAHTLPVKSACSTWRHIYWQTYFKEHDDNVQALQKQVSVQVLGAQGRLMEDERTCATVAPKCCGNVANQTVSVLANHANSWRT